MTCAPCAHATEHGWWGPGFQGTHCRGCHRSWTGKSEVHCHLCHQHFSSGSAADVAHIGNECRDPATVESKAGVRKLAVVERASGPTWVWAGADGRFSDAPRVDAEAS